MARTQKKAAQPSSKKLELDPDALPEFEALAKRAAKMGHRLYEAAKKAKKSAGRD